MTEYACQDLSDEEHAVLMLLTKHRNRRTDIVNASDYDLGLIDALVELGFVKRLAGGRRHLVVLRVCPGHGTSLGLMLDNVEPPNIASETQVRGKPPVLGGVVEGSRQKLPAGTASNRKLARTKSQLVQAVVDHFATSARTYHFGCRLDKYGRIALGKNVRGWVDDGATPEELHWMVDHFFSVLSVRRPGLNVWKLFVARRGSLVIAYQRDQEYLQMMEGAKTMKFHDPTGIIIPKKDAQ